MQIGQGEGQGIAYGVVVFLGLRLGEQRQLRRLGALLQLPGGVQAHGGIIGEQLVAGPGVGDQPAQAVVQAQFARAALRLGIALGGAVASVGFDKGALVAVGGHAALLQRIE
ncbi:hypothetical protein SRABI70_04594 [Pseudomonas sp. Bi70]|nr:hypothetical protein SRABI70_04594 [Pseudomonas sp. Bi70]